MRTRARVPSGIVELQNTEDCPATLRDQMRVAAENEQFCNEHYAADYEEDYYALSALAFTPAYSEWRNSKRPKPATPASAAHAAQDGQEGGRSECAATDDGGDTVHSNNPDTSTSNINSDSTAGKDGSAVTTNVVAEDGMPAPLDSIDFTKAEMEQLLRLPRKEYILTDPKAVMISMIDIVFAWVSRSLATLSHRSDRESARENTGVKGCLLHPPQKP